MSDWKNMVSKLRYGSETEKNRRQSHAVQENRHKEPCQVYKCVYQKLRKDYTYNLHKISCNLSIIWRRYDFLNECRKVKNIEKLALGQNREFWVLIKISIFPVLKTPQIIRKCNKMIFVHTFVFWPHSGLVHNIFVKTDSLIL